MAISDLWFAHADTARRAFIWSWANQGGLLGYVYSDGKGNVTFKDGAGQLGDTEHWRRHNGWNMCAGFSPPAREGEDWPTEPEYQFRILRARMTDLSSGRVFELPPVEGYVHYYIPEILPRDPIKVENWAEERGGEYKLFWATILRPTQRVLNVVYPDKTQQLVTDGIVQQEAWWSDPFIADGIPGKWFRGSGTAPFDKHGKPQLVDWKSDMEVGLAPGCGVWYYKDLITGAVWGHLAGWVW